MTLEVRMKLKLLTEIVIMLTNKGYYIPKYLYRRKIELIKRKIIKRKYGYLFYRKTVSHILPSQARKHYENCLRKKYFNRWVLLWYKEAIEWKLMLRADIHYKLSLQLRFLRRWKYFHIQQKTIRIKEQIARIHHQRNCVRQLELFYLNKWKMYIKYKREKLRKLQFAWIFYKSKCKPEVLVPFFNRWRVFSNVTKKNKIKLAKAIKFFEEKLTRKIFNKMVDYTKERRLQNEIEADALKLYKNKLLQKSIKAWLLFANRKQQKRENVVLAHTHYYFKLKLNGFRRILRNRNRKQQIRYNLTVITELQRQRIMTCYFRKLKLYIQYRRQKKQKAFLAILHYEKDLRKKTLHRWENYLKYKTEKRKSEKCLLEKTIELLNLYLIKKCIAKWKIFNLHRVQKKQKISIASRFYKKCLLKYAFKMWTYLVNYKKDRKKMKIDAINYHSNRVNSRSISAWKCYVKEETEFKQKLLAAKNYYKRKVINEGLLVVLKAGLHRKNERFCKSRDKLYRQLFLAQKYVSIWKQNVFYKDIEKGGALEMSADIEELEGNKENIPQVSNFDWYQICFLTPRLPKNYVEQLSDNS